MRQTAGYRLHPTLVVTRYDTVASARGAGNQAAVPPDVYLALERSIGVEEGERGSSSAAIECYSSPLNHRQASWPGGGGADTMPLFGTAFPDVDAPFGGVGRFEDLASGDLRVWPPCGHRLLLLNPPFGPRQMLRLASTLTELLQREATAPRRRTTALVVVPSLAERGEHAPHLDAFQTSPFTVAAMRLPAGDHYFLAGLAHQRTRPRALSKPHRHESAIYLLSSCPESAASTSGAVMEAVHAAFRPPL